MASDLLMDVTALSYYLQRIRTFIESKKKTLLLPRISTDIRDVLVKLVHEGVGFLQNDEFSAIVKLEGRKLGSTIKTHERVKLTHQFQIEKRYGSIVLMYKKLEVNTFKVPEPVVTPRDVDTASAVPSVVTRGISIPNAAIMKWSPYMEVPCQVFKVKSYIEKGKLTEEFLMDSLKRMLDFLCKEEEASVIFSKCTYPQTHFLRHLERICVVDAAHAFFNSECQKYLKDIKSIVSSNKVIYKLQLARGERGCKTIKDVHIIKQPLFSDAQEPEETNEDQSSSPDNFIESTKALTIEERQKILEYKQIKDRLVQMKGESYITDKLQQIYNFLSPTRVKKSITFEELTEIEESFLRHVNVWCRMDEVYPMFSEECQTLLSDIKLCSVGYLLEYNNLEWYGGADGKEIMSDVTITKKLTGQVTKKQKAKEVQARAASIKSDTANRRARNAATRAAKKQAREAYIPPITGKATLMEGLAQPVQSDKATKIMQSMGWKGGALGLRGDGITEPLMPVLDAPIRAGFGHETTKPKQGRFPFKTQERKAYKQNPTTKDAKPSDLLNRPQTSAVIPDLNPLHIIESGKLPKDADQK